MGGLPPVGLIVFKEVSWLSLNRRELVSAVSVAETDLDYLSSLSAGNFDAVGGRDLVVLHTHHRLLVHSESGSLFNRGSEEHADRECGRPGGPV